MEVKKLSVEVTAEGKLVSVSALFPSGNKIEADDVAELQRVLGELQGGPSAPTEAPPTGRRGRSSAPSAAAEATSPVAAPQRARRGATSPAAPATAEASDAAPSTTASPSEGRRRRSAPEPEAAAPAEEPRRRRGAAAEPEAPKTPSDADLVKAATAANEALTKALGKEGQEKILDLMDEYDGTDGKPVTRIDKLKAEDRDDFLKRLKALVADNT
jgi:hypothetical protein